MMKPFGIEGGNHVNVILKTAGVEENLSGTSSGTIYVKAMVTSVLNIKKYYHLPSCAVSNSHIISGPNPAIVKTENPQTYDVCGVRKLIV